MLHAASTRLGRKKRVFAGFFSLLGCLVDFYFSFNSFFRREDSEAGALAAQQGFQEPGELSWVRLLSEEWPSAMSLSFSTE